MIVLIYVFLVQTAIEKICCLPIILFYVEAIILLPVSHLSLWNKRLVYTLYTIICSVWTNFLIFKLKKIVSIWISFDFRIHVSNSSPFTWFQTQMPMSLLNISINSFSQHVFSKHLLCVRHCSRPKRYTSDQKEPSPCPLGRFSKDNR